MFASKDNKVGIAVGVTEKLISKFDAVQFVKVGSEIIGGQGGGGRKDFAQAGGQDQSKIEEAFEKLKNLINSILLSNLPLCAKPLVQANIDAIGLVEVSLPC